MSQKEVLKNVLTSGRSMTVKQLARKTGMPLESVHKRVADLRSEGYSIYRNENTRGETTYRMGQPSRAMVAMAYAAAGAELFA